MTATPADPEGQPKADETPREAEALQPETGERMRRERARKEPPVIEGKAEAVSKTGAIGSGMVTGLAGGVVGAAVMMLVAYGLGYGHRLDTSGRDERMAQLETSIKALQSSSQNGQDALQISLQDLAKKLEASDVRLAAQEQALADLPPPPPDAVANKEAVDVLAARLDGYEAQQAALEARMKEAATATDLVQKALDDLEKSMPPADISERIARLSAMVTALNTALDAMAPRLEDAQKRVGALEAKAAEIDPSTRAALGLALANLARASQGAGGFEAELDAVSSLMPGMRELPALRAVSKTGVPTVASLKQSFPALVDAVFAAEAKADQSSIWSRFLGNARSLVTVRRTGDISGATSEAVLARMEEKLKLDDLAAAVQEAEGLSGAAEQAAKEWLGEARARLRLDQLVRDLSAHVAEGLAAPVTPQVKG